MRRLLCILLNAATALSLLLCVATVALWVRSYWTVDNAGYVTIRWPDPQRHNRHDLGLRTVKGKWLLWIVDNDFDFRFPHDISSPPPTVDEMRREDVTDRGFYWRSSARPPHQAAPTSSMPTPPGSVGVTTASGRQAVTITSGS